MWCFHYITLSRVWQPLILNQADDFIVDGLFAGFAEMHPYLVVGAADPLVQDGGFIIWSLYRTNNGPPFLRFVRIHSMIFMKSIPFAVI